MLISEFNLAAVAGSRAAEYVNVSPEALAQTAPISAGFVLQAGDTIVFDVVDAAGNVAFVQRVIAEATDTTPARIAYYVACHKNGREALMSLGDLYRSYYPRTRQEGSVTVVDGDLVRACPLAETLRTQFMNQPLSVISSTILNKSIKVTEKKPMFSTVYGSPIREARAASAPVFEWA